MRKVYTSPDGEKQYNRPECIVTKATKRKPSVYIYSPSDEQIVAAGWTITEEIDPIPEPYIPTIEELVRDAIRNGADGGRKYSEMQEFHIARLSRKANPTEEEQKSIAEFDTRVELAIMWAYKQPHRAEEDEV